MFDMRGDKKLVFDDQNPLHQGFPVQAERLFTQPPAAFMVSLSIFYALNEVLATDAFREMGGRGRRQSV
jgi:hypothetical protein